MAKRNNRQRGKKVLATVLAMIMLFAMAVTATAAETLTITAENKDGEMLSLMNINGVLGRAEEDLTRGGGTTKFPTYICSSDFSVDFLEAASVKYCKVTGLEWQEAKQDPSTMTFIEEGYNSNGKIYKPDGNKFVNPNDGTKVFQIIASVTNEKGVDQLKHSTDGWVFLVIDDSFVPTTETVAPSVQADTTPVAADEKVTAIYTNSKVIVDGQEIAFEAYNINGNNYFKLRDIAYAFGTVCNSDFAPYYGFEVKWDETLNAINIIASGESDDSTYTAVGGEMVLGDGTDKEAKLTSSSVFVNGNSVNLTAYNINDNNYFKLRDLGTALGFAVDWDADNDSVIICTYMDQELYDEVYKGN